MIIINLIIEVYFSVIVKNSITEHIQLKDRKVKYIHSIHWIRFMLKLLLLHEHK